MKIHFSVSHVYYSITKKKKVCLLRTEIHCVKIPAEDPRYLHSTKDHRQNCVDRASPHRLGSRDSRQLLRVQLEPTNSWLSVERYTLT